MFDFFSEDLEVTGASYSLNLLSLKTSLLSSSSFKDSSRLTGVFLTLTALFWNIFYFF